MTDQEMITTIQGLLDDARFEQYIPSYLSVAQAQVTARLYPFQPEATWANVPEKYHMLTCDIVVYLINRRGSEGETQHSESGVLRGYESAGIPNTYLRALTPFAGAII